MTQTCQECGGNRFNIEFGEKICDECGVLLVGFTQTVSQETIGMVDRSRLIRTNRMPGESNSSNDGSGDEGGEELNNWTTYEMYNFVLREWTNAMCNLGASERFHRTVFKLWAAYLHRLEVAFINPHTRNQTPKLSFISHKRDVMLLNFGKTSVTSEDLAPRAKKNRNVSELDKVRRKIENKKLLYEAKTGGKMKVMSHTVASELSRTLTDFENSAIFNTENEEVPPDRSSNFGDRSRGDQSTLWGGQSSAQGDQSSGFDGQSSFAADRSSDGGSTHFEQNKKDKSEASTSETKEYPKLPTGRISRNSFVLKWLQNQKKIGEALLESEGEESSWNGDSSGAPSATSSGRSSRRKRKGSVSGSERGTNADARKIKRSASSSEQTNAETNTRKRKRKASVSSSEGTVETNTNSRKRKRCSVSGSERGTESSSKRSSWHHSPAKNKRYSVSSRKKNLKGSVRGRKNKRKYLNKFNKITGDVVKLSSNQRAFLKKKGPFVLNFHKILGVLYLAVLMAKEDILLIDMLRWCREGHIPFMSAHHLLPQSMRLLYYDLRLLHPLKQIPSAAALTTITGNLALFLSLREVPIPPVHNIIDKFVRFLNLPETVGDISKKVCDKAESTMHVNKMALPNVEIMAAAAIILVIKLYHGLNDCYEDRLSWMAQVVDRQLDDNNSTPRKTHHLFSWHHWQRYINSLIWLCCVCDPVSSAHYHTLLPKTGHPLPSFLANTFWTNSVWNIPKSFATKQKILETLSKRVVEAEGSTLDDQLCGDDMYKATKIPLIDILQQFINKHQSSSDQSIKDYVKFGEELMNTSFKSHIFDWMYKLSDIQEDLKSKGSKLQLDPVTITKDVYLEGSTQIFTKSYENNGTQNQTIEQGENEEIKGENANETNLNETHQNSNSNETYRDCNWRETLLNSDHFFVPQPLDASWKVSSSFVGRIELSEWKKVPLSFRWLIKLMSLVCETSRWHIVWMLRKLEIITIAPELKKKDLLAETLNASPIKDDNVSENYSIGETSIPSPSKENNVSETCTSSPSKN